VTLCFRSAGLYAGASKKFSGGTTMKTPILTAAALVTAFAVSSAQAQQPQTVRVNGKIEGVDGPTLVVKTNQGEARVNVTADAQVYGVVHATMSDLKPGVFIGVGATPQADGSQKAIRIMIFAERMRGNGEGHRPWDRPGTTMTNATVEATVGGMDGPVLTVKYKQGDKVDEKKIIVGPDAAIMAYVVSDKKELAPGANIAINAAVKKPDGSLEANRINVGRGNIVP
jgi:hypothetical protein